MDRKTSRSIRVSLSAPRVGWDIISTSGNDDKGHDHRTAGHCQPEKKIPVLISIETLAPPVLLTDLHQLGQISRQGVFDGLAGHPAGNERRLAHVLENFEPTISGKQIL